MSQEPTRIVFFHTTVTVEDPLGFHDERQLRAVLLTPEGADAEASRQMAEKLGDWCKDPENRVMVVSGDTQVEWVS